MTNNLKNLLEDVENNLKELEKLEKMVKKASSSVGSKIEQLLKENEILYNVNGNKTSFSIDIGVEGLFLWVKVTSDKIIFNITEPQIPSVVHSIEKQIDLNNLSEVFFKTISEVLEYVEQEEKKDLDILEKIDAVISLGNRVPTHTRNFLSDLISQVNKGRQLSLKQISVAEKLYSSFFNTAPQTSQNVDSGIKGKLEELLSLQLEQRTRDFLQSVLSQLNSGRTLSPKQIAAVDKVYSNKNKLNVIQNTQPARQVQSPQNTQPARQVQSPSPAINSQQTSQNVDSGIKGKLEELLSLQLEQRAKEFLQSVLSQLNSGRTLSPKQIAAVDKFYDQKFNSQTTLSEVIQEPEISTKEGIAYLLNNSVHLEDVAKKYLNWLATQLSRREETKEEREYVSAMFKYVKKFVAQGKLLLALQTAGNMAEEEEDSRTFKFLSAIVPKIENNINNTGEIGLSRKEEEIINTIIEEYVGTVSDLEFEEYQKTPRKKVASLFIANGQIIIYS